MAVDASHLLRTIHPNSSCSWLASSDFKDEASSKWPLHRSAAIENILYSREAQSLLL